MLHKTDYGLVYNDDGSLCVTHQKDGAVAVEEGTTNLALNPTFTNPTSEWGSATSVTLGQTTSDTPFGKLPVLTVEGSGNAYIVLSSLYRWGNLPGNSEPVTISLWMRNLGNDEATPKFYLGNGYRPANKVLKANGEWMQISRTFQPGEYTQNGVFHWYKGVEGKVEVCALQVEYGKPFPTSFVDGTRPDGILAYPIALKDDYTIACYRKSHTDEDYKHVVKLSDGTVYVDGVEDSGYDVGWIAGRNLILDSGQKKESSGYLIASYVMSENYSHGQVYTCRLKGSVNEGQSIGIWFNGAANNQGFMTKIKDDIWELTFTARNYGNYTENGPNANEIRFYNYPSSGATSATIEWVKLEKGNKATDWTPAPEDLGYDGDMLMLSNHTGRIKDLKILPYIATDKEIKQMYSGGTFDVTDKGIVIADNYSEVGPMNGIIAWWPLDGHTDDYSGNNNHATNNGATITSGIRGRAYEFDGSSYIRASNPFVQGAPFSISFWTKISSTSTQCLGCTRTAIGNGMSIFVISNKLRFDTDHQWTTGYTVPQNEWIHVVLMQDTSGKKLYINGELEDSTSSVGSMSNLSSIFQIGASHSNGSSLGNYLNGVVSDYRIYNRALSPQEVKILFDVTKPNAVPMQLSKDGTVYLSGEVKEV